MHTVAILALPDVIAFDLSVPVEVFGRVVLGNGDNAYRLVVCGTEPAVSAGPLLRIATDHGLDALAGADTVVIPGRNDADAEVPAQVTAALRGAFDSGARIASICTGAFILAAAGLLDGRRATTHWMAADLFRGAFPAVDLDPDVLYVDEGQILTSAGASAGLDLCLHMVANDFGAAAAATAGTRLGSSAVIQATASPPSANSSAAESGSSEGVRGAGMRGCRPFVAGRRQNSG